MALSEQRDPFAISDQLTLEIAGLKKDLADLALAQSRNIKENEIARLEVIKNALAQEKKLEEDRRKLQAETAELEETRRVDALNRILTKQRELLEEYESELNSRNINTETAAGKRAAANLKQRLKDNQAIEQTNKRAAEYIERLPLVGKKLGERGNLLDVFQRIGSITDDVTGKIAN